jgi:hypothetical protein
VRVWANSLAYSKEGSIGMTVDELVETKVLPEYRDVVTALRALMYVVYSVLFVVSSILDVTSRQGS